MSFHSTLSASTDFVRKISALKATHASRFSWPTFRLGNSAKGCLYVFVILSPYCHAPRHLDICPHPLSLSFEILSHYGKVCTPIISVCVKLLPIRTALGIRPLLVVEGGKAGT